MDLVSQLCIVKGVMFLSCAGRGTGRRGTCAR